MAKVRSSMLRVVRIGKLLVAGSLFICGTLLTAQAGPDESGNSLGIVASKNATAKDVGLPVYPGAKVAQRDVDGDPTAQLGLWVGGTGMKLVLLKLESDDTPGKIASFYRTALAKYGKVLDCTGNKSSDSQKQDSKSKELTCEDDHSDDGVVLKAGTKDNQHIVSIKTKASSRIIQLVYLVSRNEDKKI